MNQVLSDTILSLITDCFVLADALKDVTAALSAEELSDRVSARQIMTLYSAGLSELSAKLCRLFDAADEIISA